MNTEYLLSLLDSKKLYINNRQKFEDLNEHGWKLGLKGSFPPIPQEKNKQKQKALDEESYANGHRPILAAFHVGHVPLVITQVVSLRIILCGKLYF